MAQEDISAKVTSSPESINRHDSPELEAPPAKRLRLSGGATQAESWQDFKPGAIVRIRMRNFMVYEDIAYDFSPALNMIIGPNGAGKSTVVTGICIGLGFNHTLMGRATHVVDTIKHGCQTANLDVELKNEDGKPNIVISRQFSHGDAGGRGANDWHINGKRSTHKSVMEIVLGFKCQIDNLCQFLPQDKVASFARMKPIEMLAQTLRTIGDGSLGNLQSELIDLQKKIQREGTTKQTDEEALKALKDRQEVARRDVERFKERENCKQEIEIRKMRLPFAKYNQARIDVNKAKEDHKAVKADLLALRTANQPMELKETELTDVFVATNKQAVAKKTRLDKAMKDVEIAASKLKHAEETMKSYETAIKDERDAEKKNKNKIKELKDAVAASERGLGPEPEVQGEIEELNAQIQRLNQASRADRNEAESLKTYLDTKKSEHLRKKEEIERLDSEIGRLSDFKTARMQVLKQRNPDAYDAVMWLKDNRDKFEKPVFNPVFLEVQVTNSVFARAAQHVIMQNAFTFTCLTRADYTTFNKLLVDGKSAGRPLRLNVSEYSRTNAPQMKDHRALISKDEVKQYGFDGFLLDCLDGPEAILNTLCHTARIHKLPVGTRELTRNETQIIEDAKKGSMSLFGEYITKNAMTKISRAYGQTSSSSEGLNNDGKIFAATSDKGKEAELKGMIEELRQSINTEVPMLKEKDERYNEIRAKTSESDEEKKKVSDARATLTKRKSDWKALHTRATQKRNELERLQNAPAPYQDNMAATRALQIAKTKEYTVLVLDYKDKIAFAKDCWEKHMIAASSVLQAQADKELFDIRNREVRDEISNLENVLDQRKQAKDRLVAGARQIHADAVAAVENLTEEERDIVNDFPHDITPGEIEHQIEDFKNRLNYLAETSGNVLDLYEAREQEIAKLQESVSNKDAVLLELAQTLEERKQGFDTQLEEMRAAIDTSFGAAFRSISCLGEIRIGKPAEYENWCLEIYVQFRDEDELQLLTGERQSGGERAVSTIFYLMALQSLSIAPFRVLDEINQGMDAKNERKVHARMVQVSCEGDTSQYFLVTPKLLPDLVYHRNMKIHCVTSGNLGRSGNKLHCSKYLSALRARKIQTQQTQVVH